MSSKKMAKKKGLLAQVNTSVGLQYRMDNIGQKIYNTKTELVFESPHCYDNLTLCSDFDGLIMAN